MGTEGTRTDGRRALALTGARRGFVLTALTLAVALVAGLVVGRLAPRASGESADRCVRFASESLTRSEEVTGRGADVLVVGDSWSVGLGLADGADSWPSRLPGRVHVAGFSGSGFSRYASDCYRVSFAERADVALAGVDRHALVVVAGGLNDVDQTDAAIRRGFADLMRTLRGHRVVVVGPAAAPSRVAAVPRVERLLRDLSHAYAVPFVSADRWRLAYLSDDLHLTPTGHRVFGDRVASALAQVTPARPRTPLPPR